MRYQLIGETIIVEWMSLIANLPKRWEPSLENCV